MISKKHKCIFIHIPKTAGTSIEKKLGHFDELTFGIQDHRTLQEIKNNSNRKLQVKKVFYAVKRRNYKRILVNVNNAISPEITESDFNNYFKFTFVRNTWSRVFSWYNMIVTDDFYHKKKFGMDKNPLIFKDFVKQKLDSQKLSQLRYISTNNGFNDLDFIGRFENLNNDFAHVCDILGIEDKKLPKLNSYKYKRYDEVYDEQTKNIIYEMFKEEIDYFNFEFGE